MGLHETPGGRWFVSCDCGLVSTTRRTSNDAVGALLHHLDLAAAAWKNTGLPLPKEAPEVVRPEAQMRRRHPQYDVLRRAEETHITGQPASA